MADLILLSNKQKQLEEYNTLQKRLISKRFWISATYLYDLKKFGTHSYNNELHMRQGQPFYFGTRNESEIKMLESS